jgi:transcriptional regulator with XRE-family HTH domain
MEDQLRVRLNQFLLEKNLSQSEFARITGYPQKNISGFLTGTVKMPKIDFTIALATYFPELNLRWLLLGEGEMINLKTIEINKDSIEIILEQQRIILEQQEKILADIKNK